MLTREQLTGLLHSSVKSIVREPEKEQSIALCESVDTGTIRAVGQLIYLPAGMTLDRYYEARHKANAA